MNIATYYHVAVKILCISISELCDLTFKEPRKKFLSACKIRCGKMLTTGESGERI